jgi:hypothetical protein
VVERLRAGGMLQRCTMDERGSLGLKKVAQGSGPRPTAPGLRSSSGRGSAAPSPCTCHERHGRQHARPPRAAPGLQLRHQPARRRLGRRHVDRQPVIAEDRAVGAEGARALIRAALRARGFVEGTDFVVAA